jgi:DNA-binding response OmpR family regulator
LASASRGEETDSFSNVVKITISGLRTKLGDPPLIETCRPRVPWPDSLASLIR